MTSQNLEYDFMEKLDLKLFCLTGTKGNFKQKKTAFAKAWRLKKHDFSRNDKQVAQCSLQMQFTETGEEASKVDNH